MLIATSIIEVDVDVANATAMMIENAERFGIAQLHQLRGRLGRSQHPAACFVLGSGKHDEAEQRLAALVQHHDGLESAERVSPSADLGRCLALRWKCWRRTLTLPGRTRPR